MSEKSELCELSLLCMIEGNVWPFQSSCKFVLPASFPVLLAGCGPEIMRSAAGKRDCGLFSPDSARARLRDIQLSKSQYGDTPGHTPVCNAMNVFHSHRPVGRRNGGFRQFGGNLVACAGQGGRKARMVLPYLSAASNSSTRR